MSKPARSLRQGFTMVEMLVALFFVSILMAGLAKVFRSGVKTFVSGSEKVGALRRSRMSLDLLQEELNAAGQFLIALGGGYPPLQEDGFQVLPQVDYTDGGVDAKGKAIKLDVDLDDPEDRFSAEVTMVLDEVLPMEGQITGLGSAGTMTHVQMVAAGTDVTALSDTFTVKFAQPLQATHLQEAFRAGSELFAVFRNGYECKALKAGAASGSTATLTLSPAVASADGTPTGSSGMLFQNVQKNDDRVLFVQRLSRISYAIQPMKLDPSGDKATPCLVRRDLGTGTSTLVAENVINLGVDLSVDGGQTWLESRAAGYRGGDRTAQLDVWANKFKSDLQGKLSAGSQALQRMQANPFHWFRELPVMVRLRVKTRTAISREEHSSTVGQRRYHIQEQAVILNPKHFGLPF